MTYLCTKFDDIYQSYTRDIKEDAKHSLNVLKIVKIKAMKSCRHSEGCIASYSHFIEIMRLSCTVFELFVKSRKVSL